MEVSARTGTILLMHGAAIMYMYTCMVEWANQFHKRGLQIVHEQCMELYHACFPQYITWPLGFRRNDVTRFGRMAHEYS